RRRGGAVAGVVSHPRRARARPVPGVCDRQRPPDADLTARVVPVGRVSVDLHGAHDGGGRRHASPARERPRLTVREQGGRRAAGHRPCAECRRDDYVRFRAAWARAISEDISADGMDVRLDADRLAGPMIKRTYQDASSALPDGAFVDIGGAAWLVWRGALHAW